MRKIFPSFFSFSGCICGAMGQAGQAPLLVVVYSKFCGNGASPIVGFPISLFFADKKIYITFVPY
jgi:hypothetical protein